MQQHYKRCPEFDMQVLDMHSKGMTLTRIGEIMGAGRHTISNVVNKKPLMTVTFPKETKEEIVSLAKEEGMSITQIAKKLGLSKSRVQRVLAPHRDKVPYAKRKAVKTDKNLQAVTDLWNRGFSQKYMKKVLGISGTTVIKCLDKAESLGKIKREVMVSKVHIRKQEKIFETKNTVKENTYPLQVNSKTIIYVSINTPREQALQQWKEKQQQKEKAFLKELRSMKG